jgi:hypothetical protein
MSDAFEHHTPGLESPASRLASVTPDDATDLAWATRAIAVATNGNVQITTVDGHTGTIYVAAGVPFPIRAQRVWATGTTATGIAALA